ncbi:MAG: hypothetical protein HRJ53_12885 [Acidobacteria bacterium Pan2503]|uniref:Uncharacterized protein n=1 Tax=Candidatus Acidiferrum panamense TaxID=2741543 RepID=A0A7V8NR21_9BACT|nr:hypothetical protein [Candidatus Acidoferrum panamensis]
MIKLPLGQRGLFVIIEPSNVARMKSGWPLFIREVDVMVAFTPDMQALTEMLLDHKHQMPGPNQEHWHNVRLTPEQLDAALKACQKLPEVLR